jgi:SAM-dependent methyltransferase
MATNKRRSEYIHPKDQFLAGNESLVNHAAQKLLYHELAPYFDIATSRDTEREVQALHEIIQRFRPATKNVLDLGCGIGRHAGKLYEIGGYSVTGVDQSENMLSQAQQRHPSCIFHCGDIRTVRLEQRFDVAIIMWTTFNYLSTLEDTTTFFSNVHQHLCEDGLCIIDVKNYALSAERSYTREDQNAEVKVRMTIEKKVEHGFNEAIYHYEITNLKTGEVENYTDQEIAKVYDAEQITGLAVPYFAPIMYLGDYDIEAEYIPDTSERIITVLQRQSI